MAAPKGEIDRGYAGLIGIHVRAPLQQHVHHGEVPMLRCIVQRNQASILSRVHMCSPRKQHLHHRRVTRAGGIVQRCFALLLNRVDRRAALQQQLHQLIMPIERCQVESRLTASVRCVQIGAAVHQDTQHFRSVVLCRHVERRPLQRVLSANAKAACQ